MIKVKGTYKSKKLTVDQKALKKCMTPLAREVKTAIRDDMPVASGALKQAVDYRVYSRKGNTVAVIGVRNTYTKTVKGVVKQPNLYAKKQGAKAIMTKHINQRTVDRLNDEVKKVAGELLK